jgi:hypothetical protein
MGYAIRISNEEKKEIMPSWGISDKASDKEKIKSKFADYINGLNCVGEIDYPTYSDLFDEGMKLLDEVYEQGKKDQVTIEKEK